MFEVQKLGAAAPRERNKTQGVIGGFFDKKPPLAYTVAS